MLMKLAWIRVAIALSVAMPVLATVSVGSPALADEASTISGWVTSTFDYDRRSSGEFYSTVTTHLYVTTYTFEYDVSGDSAPTVTWEASVSRYDRYSSESLACDNVTSMSGAVAGRTGRLSDSGHSLYFTHDGTQEGATFTSNGYHQSESGTDCEQEPVSFEGEQPGGTWLEFADIAIPDGQDCVTGTGGTADPDSNRTWEVCRGSLDGGGGGGEPADDDGDGVPNDIDGCPTEFGPATNNGCPLIGPPVVECEWHNSTISSGPYYNDSPAAVSQLQVEFCNDGVRGWIEDAQSITVADEFGPQGEDWYVQTNEWLTANGIPALPVWGTSVTRSLLTVQSEAVASLEVEYENCAPLSALIAPFAGRLARAISWVDNLSGVKRLIGLQIIARLISEFTGFIDCSTLYNHQIHVEYTGDLDGSYTITWTPGLNYDHRGGNALLIRANESTKNDSYFSDYGHAAGSGDHDKWFSCTPANGFCGPSAAP